MKPFSIILILLLVTGFSHAPQTQYPQNDFIAPVKYPMKLTGTFGELRPNHFHAGIDIKPQRGVGEPLYAVADGYVARVKVSSVSYGNALYINHPNGYTSVYAHLDQFSPEIQEFIKDHQYKNETFEVDLYPPKWKFPFQQGDKIGTLGLSGRSYGAHLHFEIRDTESEKPINPLLFGFKVKDDIKPMINELKVYHLNTEKRTIASKIYKIRKGSNRYYIPNDTLIIGAWRVGLGLKTYDKLNGLPNWNGIYKLEMYQDDQLIYDFDMESVAFHETRYINAHTDYPERLLKKSYFNRCYRLPGNQLSIYNQQFNDGVITLHKNKASKIEFKIQDVEGNTSTFWFYVRRGQVKAASTKNSFNYIIPYTQETTIEQDNLYLQFPQGAFYEQAYLSYSAEKNWLSKYSHVHQIDKSTTPVHKYFKIGIRPTNIPEHLRNKAYIAYRNHKKEIEGLGGSWQGNLLVTKTRQLGAYFIKIDTTAPKITPIRFSSSMNNYKRMTFRIQDKESGIASYRATVDGHWILIEYDTKNDLLIHRFDEHIAKGNHQLRLVVTDDRGNETIFVRNFKR